MSLLFCAYASAEETDDSRPPAATYYRGVAGVELFPYYFFDRCSDEDCYEGFGLSVSLPSFIRRSQPNSFLALHLALSVRYGTLEAGKQHRGLGGLVDLRFQVNPGWISFLSTIRVGLYRYIPHGPDCHHAYWEPVFEFGAGVVVPTGSPVSIKLEHLATINRDLVKHTVGLPAGSSAVPRMSIQSSSPGVPVAFLVGLVFRI